MFFEKFERNFRFGPTMMDISFSQQIGEFTMEIFCKDIIEAIKLKDQLLVFGKPNQNFTVECDEKAMKVKVVGNISKAFNIIVQNKLMSADLLDTILADIEVENFLSRTQSFIFPGNKVVDENMGKGNEDIKSITEEYVEYLSKLSRPKLEIALESLRLNLASKGVYISIRFLDSEEKIQPSFQGQ